MKLDDISLTKKLWGSIILLLAAMLALGGWIQFSNDRAHRQAAEQTERARELITLTTQWKSIGQLNTERMIAGMSSSEAAVTALFGERMKSGIAASSETLKQIQALATTEADKRAMDAVTERRKEVLALVKKGNELKTGGDSAAVQAFLSNEFMPVIARYEAAQDAVVQVQRDELARTQQAAEAALARTALLGLLATAAVCAAGLAWAAVLLRSIHHPLQRAVALAEAVAAGDLSQTVDEARRDELGRLMRGLGRMSAQLRGLVDQVRQGVSSVSVASTQIATGNHDLSSRTEQTASNLQETASSLEQLTGTVGHSADTAQQASTLAADAAAAARRGGEVVGEVVHSMDRIAESSRKIADIISVIDGIAFQTNILALNAAVEAARAGEQGRGFAVVAGEVRTLAQRSADAARQVKVLIGSSVDAVEHGSGQVGQARETMQEIVAGVQQVSTLIAELASAAVEQRDGIRQVNQSVEAIDTMTQQNAALVEESTAAAASLQSQAQRLQQQVATFRT